MKVIFIAGKFRGANGWEIEKNVREVERLALVVWHLGAAALAPHMTNRFFHGTLPDQVFLDGVTEFLRRSDALLTAPGWEASAGAQAEVEEARRRSIPVFHELADLKTWLSAKEICDD